MSGANVAPSPLSNAAITGGGRIDLPRLLGFTLPRTGRVACGVFRSAAARAAAPHHVLILDQICQDWRTRVTASMNSRTRDRTWKMAFSGITLSGLIQEPAHTSRSGATIGSTGDTVSPSTDASRPGTLPRCQTCSIRAYNYKPRDRRWRVTSRRADSECGVRKGQAVPQCGLRYPSRVPPRGWRYRFRRAHPYPHYGWSPESTRSVGRESRASSEPVTVGKNSEGGVRLA